MKTIEEKYECDICNTDNCFESEINEVHIKVKYPKLNDEIVYKKHLCHDCMVEFELKFDL